MSTEQSTGTTRREAAIDTELAELSKQSAKLARGITWKLNALHSLTGDRQALAGRWKRLDGETLVIAEAMLKAKPDFDRKYGYGTEGGIFRALSEMTALKGEHAIVLSRISELDAIFRAAPWSRFFLVLNAGGHIHSSMRCATCRPTTAFGWLPELSGLAEADAVEAQGPYLCSVCFPSAPAEWRRDRADVPDAARIARDAAKAGRAARLAAKTLTEDEQFRDYSGDRVTTVAGCKEALRDEIAFRDCSGTGPHPWHPASVTAAGMARAVLLAREARQPGTGATEDEISKIVASAITRNRKEGARI